MQVNKLTILLIFIISIVFSGCIKPTFVEKQDIKTPNEFVLNKVEKEKGVKKEWGLAMSGGGLRSALFNIGVLKSLYARGILNKFDIISSVSGGSYASYWLYSNEIKTNNTKQFGYNSLDDSVFTNNICKLTTYGNFVTYGAMLKSAISYNETLDEMYEDKINRTFGDNNQTSYKLKYQDVPVNDRIPYMIVNSTISANNKYTLMQSLIESTPLLIGNKYDGVEIDNYEYLNNENYKDYTIVKGSAISGAAIKEFLNQKIKKPKGIYYSNSELINLSDGGHSENLGAIALILRGVDNILIIDAEEDSEYIFEGYTKLKDMLIKMKLDLIIQDNTIEKIKKLEENKRKNSFKTSIFTGKVIPKGKIKEISTIHYIKMSIPDSLKKRFILEKKSIGEGALISRDLVDKLNMTKKGDLWDCNVLSNVDYEKVFLYNLEKYYHFAKDKYNFPHYSTLDQSYYLDQSLATMALGYFLGNEFDMNVIKKSSQFD